MIVNHLPDSFLLMMSSYLPAPPLGCLSNTCTWSHYVVHIPLWQLKPVPFGSGPQTYLGTTSSSLLQAVNTRFHSWTFPKVLPKPFFPALALLRTTDLLEAHEIAALSPTSFRVSKIVQPIISQEKRVVVPMCACQNCRPPWATSTRRYQTIRRPETAIGGSGWWVLYYSPEDDAETDSDAPSDSRSASDFPVESDAEAIALPDRPHIWNQMMSHRGQNDWDLLAAVWSYLGCRPPGAASRHTNQMIAATMDFLGFEEITRLESKSNTYPNINDLPWWPTDEREEWRRLNNVYTFERHFAPETPSESLPSIPP
jgi:hypothetical protein